MADIGSLWLDALEKLNTTSGIQSPSVAMVNHQLWTRTAFSTAGLKLAVSERVSQKGPNIPGYRISARKTVHLGDVWDLGSIQISILGT